MIETCIKVNDVSKKYTIEILYRGFFKTLTLFKSPEMSLYQAFALLKSKGIYKEEERLLAFNYLKEGNTIASFNEFGLFIHEKGNTIYP